jgi:ATP-dependent Lhr-like helicase
MKGMSGTDGVIDVLLDAAVDDTPPLELLLAETKNLQREKWDWALPDPLLRKAYASQYLDLDEAIAWLRALPSTT